MFRPLPFFIGLRYTRAKRRNHYISFISLTSMIGLALGVLAMIIVLSVMNGFQKEMRTRILGMVPHATISATQPLDDWQTVANAALRHREVVGAAPFAELQGMLSYKGNMLPVLVNGIDPQEERKVSIIGEHIVQGSLDDLKPGEFGIVLGEITARRFHVNVGDKLTLIVPEATSAPGGITPRMQRFTIVALFKVGAELDNSLALIDIADAGQLLRLQPGQVPSVRLELKDLYQSPQVAAKVVKELGQGFRSSDWTRAQGSLFNAMKMEKTMIGLLLLLIIAVAAFNIIATLIMVVADKRTDIAILRTLGATPRQIMAIFMVQGTVIGVIGTVIGGVLGVFAALNITGMIDRIERLVGHKVFSSDVYFINYLPSDLQVLDVVLICSAALLMSFLATLYPSWRAARTQPAESLRYERARRPAPVPAWGGQGPRKSRLRGGFFMSGGSLRGDPLATLPAASAPTALHPPAPVEHRQRVAEDGGDDAAHHRTEQEGLPEAGQLLADPFPGEMVRQGARRHLHQPGAQLVGAIEDRGHRDRIGQPDQSDGDWQIAPNPHRQTGRQQHLHRHRDEGGEQPGGHGA